MTEPSHETAARAAYDHSAAMYAAQVGTELSERFETPMDRGVLGAFVETVASSGPGSIVDIGCGTGRAAAFVAAHGVAVSGVDIAPGMIAEARSAHPHIRFELGTLTELSVPDGSVAGALYWYSIITTPPAELPAVWCELDRVLTSNGHALVAFQSGNNDADERREAYGSSADLTLFRHSVDDVDHSLAAAGFDVRARVVREPEFAHETTAQVFLLVRRQPV